jgi:hypothetical protein
MLGVFLWSMVKFIGVKGFVMVRHWGMLTIDFWIGIWDSGLGVMCDGWGCLVRG